MPDLLETTRRQLKTLASPGFADQLRWFFKEPVDPYGVRSPEIQRVSRDLYQALKSWPVAERDQFMEELWKSGKLEEGVVATHVYRRFSKECGPREFAMFERWINRYVRNWSHTDGVASWLIAASIANRPELMSKIPAWTKSRNRWKRRAAAVSFLQEAKQGRNTENIFKICDVLRDDPDEMVQKGVGWVLKETYPKKPSEVLQFLESWRSTAPRLVLRYAAEKMAPQDKRWLLQRNS